MNNDIVDKKEEHHITSKIYEIIYWGHSLLFAIVHGKPQKKT